MAYDFYGGVRLGGSSADLSVHQSIGQLSTVPPSEVFKLTSADNLFIRESQPVLPVFLTTAQRAYGVSPVTMDFNRNPEKSRIDINSWVMQNTDGKIRDLLPQGSVSEVRDKAGKFYSKSMVSYVQINCKDREIDDSDPAVIAARTQLSSY